jgi:hypothetical protein
LGSGFFFPIGGEAGTLDTGGFRNEDNGVVDGAGRLINSMNRKAGTMEIPIANDMVTSQEYEAAVAIAGSTDETIWTVEHVNGSIYKGSGTIQGDIKLDTNKSRFDLKVVCGLGFQAQ